MNSMADRRDSGCSVRIIIIYRMDIINNNKYKNEIK